MRGRVFLCLSSVLFSATTATPQCNYRLEYSAPLRSSYFDAALDGDDLWTATGYGVRLFDRATDPPRLIAGTAVPGTTRSIDARAGVAYAGSGTAVHVLRRVETRVELVRSLDVGATVNDVIATSNALFVATGNGLFLFDRRNPLDPSSPAPLATSSTNVLSLARNGEGEVLAADGDRTVERFNATSGSAAGVLNALDRSIAVSVAGARILISDGQQTQIFTTSGAFVATIAFGAVAAAPQGEQALFTSGLDRRFRALDLTNAAQPVELFAADVLPTGGTVNRVGALVTTGDRLYVAAGDAGLLTYDTARFAAPFPLRSQPFGPKTSAVDAGGALFAGNAGAGISELTRFSSGSLGQGRSWALQQVHIVHAFANDFLLTSSDRVLSYWSTRATTPTLVSSATFSGGIRSAALNGPTAIVLLDDGSVWSVDVTRQDSTPARAAVPAVTLMGRSDRGLVLGAANPQGSTDLRWYPGSDLNASPLTASVPGVTTSIAVSGTQAALFTFRGITVVDFAAAAPAEFVLPGSNTALVKGLAMRGSRLFDVTEGTLRVWDLDRRELIRSYAISSGPVAVTVHPTAAIATVLTADAVVSVHYENSSSQPLQTSILDGNRYARKIVASSTRLFVLDSAAVDVFDTGYSPAPTHVARMAVAGALDLAVSESQLFVLFGNRTVTAFTHTGTATVSAVIDEGSDTVPLNIFTAGGAPWISVSRGCLTTGCEGRTVVLDPSSLVRTAALDGGVTDLVTSGASAHAIVDVPPNIEIRSYSIADPLHPILAGSRPAEGSAEAIATDGAIVYALGRRLFAYAPPSLSKIGEELNDVDVTPATDLVIDQACAVLTGRSSAAQVYRKTAAGWELSGFVSTPATVRGIVQQGQKVIALTEYSIEVWSALPPPSPRRRRASS